MFLHTLKILEARDWPFFCWQSSPSGGGTQVCPSLRGGGRTHCIAPISGRLVLPVKVHSQFTPFSHISLSLFFLLYFLSVGCWIYLVILHYWLYCRWFEFFVFNFYFYLLFKSCVLQAYLGSSRSEFLSWPTSTSAEVQPWSLIRSRVWISLRDALHYCVNSKKVGHTLCFFKKPTLKRTMYPDWQTLSS